MHRDYALKNNAPAQRWAYHTAKRRNPFIDILDAFYKRTRWLV